MTPQVLFDGLTSGSLVELGAIGVTLDLFDPEICQFRPRRIHFLWRLCDVALATGIGLS